KVTFAPHLPADWTTMSIENLRVGGDQLRLTYRKSAEGIFLDAERIDGKNDCTIEFQPAISLRASVSKAELNGKALAVTTHGNEEDQHAAISFSVGQGRKTAHVRIENDFGVSASLSLPSLGSRSEGLRVLSEAWSASRDELTLELSGASGSN